MVIKFKYYNRIIFFFFCTIKYDENMLSLNIDDKYNFKGSSELKNIWVVGF